MKKNILLLLLLACINNTILCAQTKPFKISIEHLKDNCYIFTSWGMAGNTPFPANGLYIVTDKGVVVIDTPWGEDESQQLIDSVFSRHHKKIILSISTHFHADRTGGINVFKKGGIKTYSSLHTLKLCKQNGEPQAAYYFTKDTTFTIGGVTLQTYYPGEGHTKDNIVVWVPQQKILYGGCFIKSTDTNDIGNVADANVKAWPQSVENVMHKFPNPAYIIPGHQGWKDINALKHTLDIVKKAGK
jgi:metallo-beta-lactamase class B